MFARVKVIGVRRKTEDSGVSRKIITLKNFDLIDGYVKDMAYLQDSNDSAIIEKILLNNIFSDSADAAFYIKKIYSLGLKNALLAFIHNLSVEVQLKSDYEEDPAHLKTLELLLLIRNVLNDPMPMEVDPEFADLLNGSLISNSESVLRKIENVLEGRELSFNDKEQLQDERKLLSATNLDPEKFYPCSYMRVLLNKWALLGDYTFAYRLLYDIVALSLPGFWVYPEHRIRAIEVIKLICEEKKIEEEDYY